MAVNSLVSYTGQSRVFQTCQATGSNVRAARPLLRLSGRGSWSRKGIGGTKLSGDPGACVFSRSADEDKAGPGLRETGL